MSITYQVEDTFRTRSHTNAEHFTLWLNHNKSYACVLASLAWYKNATVTACHLALRLTWFKKYHLLFPNYPIVAFISSFNISIKETKMLIPAAESLLSKWHKTCQIVQQNQETARILRQTQWHLLKACYQSLRGLVHRWRTYSRSCSAVYLKYVKTLLSCIFKIDISVYLKFELFYC